MLSINIVEVIHLRLQISKITTVPPKKYIRTTSIFRVSNKVKKKNKKKTKNIEMTSIFFTSKFCKKSTSSVKNRWFFCHENYVKESTSKRHQFFTHQNYIEKVRRNDVEIRKYLLFDISMYFNRHWHLPVGWSLTHFLDIKNNYLPKHDPFPEMTAVVRSF